jgi:AGZA family xanthine/uracil permease-like MFS transporter
MPITYILKTITFTFAWETRMNFLKRFFKVEEMGTTVSKEIYNGLTTFLAVSYILAVNPNILSTTGMDRGAIFFATALASFVGTLVMALYANFPLALAPAMGLNVFFAYSVVAVMGYSWQIALFAVVIEGVVFFLLSTSSIREKIIDTIPLSLKYGMGAGIGLFITLIAFKNAHIIKANEVTMVTMQSFFGSEFHTAGISAILALFGVIFSTYLMHKKVIGALLIGILSTWGAGMICQILGIYHVVPDAGYYSLFPNFSTDSFVKPFYNFCDLFGSAFDVENWTCKSSTNSGWALLFSPNFLIICFALLFSDFFDTVGTVNGALIDTPLMEKDGRIPRLKQLLIADSIATLAGGVLGTSTTTTFAESAVGVKAGARTGLAALTIAFLFLISIICAPIFLVIPGFATAPALIIVGFLMIQSIAHVDWEDLTSSIPAYLLVTGIVFTYNISDGLGMGVISYTILNCGKKGRVHWVMWLVSALFVLKYICLGIK